MHGRFPLRLFSTILLICALIATQGFAQESKLCFSRVDPSVESQMQDALDAAVAGNNVPGAVLALGDTNGNSRIWTSGLADLETGQTMSEDLYFAIGSATKSYTATIVLQLVDDGLIKLDEPIGTYLPGLIPRENQITVRHLLEIRSGLGAYELK